MIRGVIFDMDGVLVDSEPYYKRALEEYLEEKDISMPQEEIDNLVGIDTRGFYNVIYKYAKSIYPTKEEMIESIDKSFRSHEMDVEELAFQDTLSLIKDLKAMGFPLALASNADHNIIEEILNILGISDVFDTISSSEDYEKGKPDPEIYIDTSRKLFLKPENVLVVEDSEVGIDAGNKSGAVVVCRKEEVFDFPQNTEHKFTDLRNIKEFIEDYNKDYKTYPVAIDSKNHLKALFFIKNLTSEDFKREKPDQIVIQEREGEIVGVLFINLNKDSLEVENWFLDSLTEEDIDEFIYEIKYLMDVREIEKAYFKDEKLEKRFTGENDEN